jgi:hypothetical protein
MSVDTYLATSSVNTAKELCKSHVGTVEGEEGKGKTVNPNPKLCRTLPKRKRHSCKSVHLSMGTATVMVIVIVF